MSPVKWLSASEYTSASKGERLVAWADSQVGVVESPKGSNDGPKIRAYLETVGLGEGGYAWCSAFAKWCAKLAGVDPELLMRVNGMANSWVHAGRKTGRLKLEPKRGRVGAYAKSADGPGHAWVCLSGATLGVFRTIEGNSNEDGSSNGYKVVKRFRTMASVRRHAVWGFVDVD